MTTTLIEPAETPTAPAPAPEPELLPLADPKAFALAGRAKFTVKNMETGGRFTFKVAAPQKQKNAAEPVSFVSVLTGSDNDNDFEFMGTIFHDGAYRRSLKSRITEKAPSAVAFAWFWPRLMAGTLPANVKVFHAGYCGRCGRTLTVPESILTGYGPECSDLLGLTRVKS